MMRATHMQLIRGALVLVALVATTARTHAQTSDVLPDPAFAKLQQKVSTGDKITVTLLDGSRLQGRFASSSLDGLSFLESGPPARIPAARIARVQRHRTGVLLGAMIGTGVGLACGLALGSLYVNEGHNPTAPILALTAAGLGAGAGLDAMLNVPRTVYRAGRVRTSASVDVGRNGAGVRLVLTF